METDTFNERMVHPLVWAWIQAQATERSATRADVIGDILKAAYAASLPQSGPCSACGEHTPCYASLDLQCPACWNAAVAALLARVRHPLGEAGTQ